VLGFFPIIEQFCLVKQALALDFVFVPSGQLVQVDARSLKGFVVARPILKRVNRLKLRRQHRTPLFKLRQKCFSMACQIGRSRGQVIGLTFDDQRQI
jgi:hypothetical protein